MNKNNTGIDNSGHWNSGHWNSGNFNSGNFNSGNRNSGNWNSGHFNSGHFNSGNRNSGNRNFGNWNSGHFNSGHFNTDTPDKVRIFNIWVDMTHDEFEEKYNIYADIPLNRWVDSSEMTDEEKEGNPDWEQQGGFLRTLDFKAACQIWWNENPERHKDFLELPAFNADIFREITGIDVTVEDDKMEEAMALLKKNGYKVVKE